ncbi:hypothetical protein Q4610_02910 [Sphingobium sp. HBC34]|uniref:Uncharacterized protein n=1 Tax=Sphingobium cyanobacteriorum TaxID=3063954 RepID=A0ABT8ZHG5_9SPHN|nr:hypothetical protein [Sphingobium sp. HBC34]MDO7833985.1 hypothetical protein [Sphingobium sp. HBC34]
MKRVMGMMAAALLLLGAGPAMAQADGQAQAQALGECMVLKSTGADRLVVARWFLTSLASAPQATGVATLTPGKKDEFDKGMAAIFTRLMAVDCADQARPLFRAKDEAGFRVAGEALGRVAMEELLNNPQARAALSAYTQYLRQEDFKAVLP